MVQSDLITWTSVLLYCFIILFQFNSLLENHCCWLLNELNQTVISQKKGEIE